ncbi:MAG: hypothetical protein NTY68_00510 [Candidatus Micrarchaeota archaeon]|nr:hypothetical protein [Candidatus Micrarchaeota archaeon]
MKISAIFISAVLIFVLFSGCLNFGGNSSNTIAEVATDNSSVTETNVVPAPSLIWSANECREFGNAKVCLEDISTDVNKDNKHYAMVAITYGSSGTEDKIAPGTSKTLNGISVSVIDTQPGSSISSPSAKMNLSGLYSSSRAPRALRKDSCINYSSSKICLSDISKEIISSSPSPAMISIIGENGSRAGELKINANGHEVAKIGGSNVAISVSDTAQGILTSKAWARVSINETAEAPAESKFTTIYKGSCKVGYGMKVCLSDLNMNDSSNAIAVFDIMDSSNVLLLKKSLGESSSYSSVVSGRRIKIDTGEIGEGYSSGTGWAKGSILILSD